MADYQFYPLGITAENAKKAINTAAELSETSGMIYADGSGNVRTAEPGNDYGFPVLYGNGVPNAYTSGSTGQLYFNLSATSSPYIYVCVDYTNRGYQWEVVGDPGDSFVIYGYYQTLDDLRYGVQNPQPGMAYGVGTAAPYTIYIYDGVTHEWINNGTLGIGGEGGGSSLPPHGTTGQVLTKASNASGDVKWQSVNTTLPDGSVTASKLAAKSVVEGKYADASIPTRAYKASSVPRSALSNDVLYSPIIKSTTDSYSIVGTDIGKTIVDVYALRNSALTWTMSKAVADAFPIGTEIAFARTHNTQSISIQTTGVRMTFKGINQVGGASATVTLKLPERGSMCALKKLENDDTYGSFWILTGDVEVAS